MLPGEDEHRDDAPQDQGRTQPHRLCLLLRQLRQAARWSLSDFETQFGIQIGPYERGDRVPPLDKLEAVFACFGYQLQVVAGSSTAIRLPQDIVADLRAIADQLEAANDVRELSHAAA